LEKLKDFQQIKKSPQFVDPASPLRHSQAPATCSYPQSVHFSYYARLERRKY